MTSNERKILECIRNHGREVHVQHVAHRTKFSSGYSLFLCHSLEKAGHLEFINPNLCKLAKKGYGYFQDHAGIVEVVAMAAGSIPQKESIDDPVLSNILSDDEGDQSQGDENVGEAEEGQEPKPDEKQDENKGSEEDKSTDSGDEEFDKAIADLEPSSIRSEDDSPSAEKDGKEEQDKPDLPAEASAQAGEQYEKTEELAVGPKGEMKTEPVEEARAETETEEKEKSENAEKTAPKEEPVKPSGGFGASFKKFVNWSAEKK